MIVEKQSLRRTTFVLLLFAAFQFASSRAVADTTEDGEEGSSAKLAIASMALYDAREDLRLWRELENQEIDNGSINQIVANSLIRNTITVGAAKIDIRDLRGGSLESLCLLTTDEAKNIMSQFGNGELAVVALSYIESVKKDVVDYVHEVQESLLGTGCGLSPGRPHF